MAESRGSGVAVTPSAGNWPDQRAGQWPGSYYTNELGQLLPEPFPPPFPPMAPPALERIQREYVAGGGWAWYGQVARTLPNAIDDATADFGDDLYERMMYDPQVASTVNLFKAAILETGMTLTSAVRSRSDPDYDIAAEIADEAAHMVTEFNGTLDDVLFNMLDCVAFGNKVAEQTYKLSSARKDGRKILVLDTLKVRPRRATVFAVDIYMNLVGLLVRVPPNASPWSATMMFGPQDEPFNLLPPQKFVITNFRVKDADPRGTSVLRPAYGPWWQKQQIIPEYLRYLTQFASPSIYGIVSEAATPVPDPNNQGSMLSVEQVLLASLQQFRNGTAGAFPSGTEINTIAMTGDGSQFLRAFEHWDQQITKAVLTQELATEEGKHMARAAATVHQDVLDTLIRQAKHGFGTQLRNQLFKRWVAYNWGEKAAHLAPLIGLGKAITREQPALWTAVSQLFNTGYIAPSQQQALDELIGLPIRDEAEVIAFGDMPVNKGKAATGGGPDGPAAPAPPPVPPAGGPPHPVTLPQPDHQKTDVQPGLPGRVSVSPHTRAFPNSRGDVPGVTGTTPQIGGRPAKRQKVLKAPGQRPAPGAKRQVYAVAEPQSSGMPIGNFPSVNANLPSASPSSFG